MFDPYFEDHVVAIMNGVGCTLYIMQTPDDRHDLHKVVLVPEGMQGTIEPQILGVKLTWLQAVMVAALTVQADLDTEAVPT